MCVPFDSKEYQKQFSRGVLKAGVGKNYTKVRREHLC